MKIYVFSHHKEMAQKVAELFARKIMEKRKIVLGLATGTTLIPFYKTLVNLYIKKKVDFSHVFTFNLDEYFGLSSLHSGSLRTFMEKHFFGKINLKKENIFFLKGDVKNWEKECQAYEEKIQACGGIDLQILGIGKNAHIAFNEPGSSFSSRTRLVQLSPTTRKANVKFFKNFEEVPEKALTMGIQTIMEAKEIFLLAAGRHKSEAIKRSLEGKISPSTPASILQKHRRVTFFLDKEGASLLTHSFLKNRNI